MSSVQYLREVIKETLTAAAEQIFSEFEKTIVRYEEEIRQLRPLDIRPGIKSHNTGDQQVFDQERSSSLHQQDPEPPQTKEVQEEEMCSSEEGEPLEQKQEAEEIDVWTGEQLDLLCKPGVELTTTDLPQQHDCKENCSQERNSSLNQEDPDLPETKEEQEEISLNQEEEQLSLKPKTKDVIVWTGQELDIMWNPEVKLERIDFPQHDCKEQEDLLQIKGEQEELSTTEEGKPFVRKQETQTFPARKESDQGEPDLSSDQLLSHNSPDTDQDESKDDNLHRNRLEEIISELPVQNSKTVHLCGTCGKIFKRMENLNRHVKIHTGEKPHCCSTCGKRFTLKAYLTEHMKIHTGEKPHCCTTCGKSFSQKGQLNSHMRIHTSEKPYFCSICGERFNVVTNLKIHMKIHTSEKPHSCSTCGKRFSRKSHLTRHIQIHTGEKPHSCSTCGKRYNRKEHLKMHMEYHTGEKPHSCSTCGKRFNRKDHLKTHMECHTGEKPHCCNTCGKKFSSSVQLKMHIGNHTACQV
ncbi:zinc finger protein 260-like [Astatotilapia calliptera]|uniref:C2H2-type domain-containing protein n=1 Tax=Astatotilapia calliptera TaxID=8154 RepID=A0A3P8PU44_ASTCA|nr:zinc finger protein 260-like [Astatotilapia calliptera]